MRSPAVDLDTVRNQLCTLCLRRGSRQLGWPYGWPCDWRPREVADPRSVDSEMFTDAGAWEYLAELLDGGHPLQQTVLRHPPGEAAYVMKVHLPGGRQLYIKLQLGQGKVIGRSFHYSY